MENILNFTAEKQKRVEHKRRSFERVTLQNTLWCRTLVEQKNSLYPVTLIDISNGGMLIQVALHRGDHRPIEKGKEIKVRMYFTENSYLVAVGKIRYRRNVLDEYSKRCLHYGFEFDKSQTSFKAINQFIQFLYSFAQHSTTDKVGHKESA